MFYSCSMKHNKYSSNMFHILIKILNNNYIVDHINNTNFLGEIIDSKLNWAAHILYIKIKISKFIGILLKIRFFFTK